MKRLWYWIKRFRSDILFVFYAIRDPRVPKQAKTLLILLVTYVLSPIDILPDFFIPLLGYVDDIVLIPLGVEVALKLIPERLAFELRNKAFYKGQKAKVWAGAALVAAVLILILGFMYRFLQI